MNNNHFFQIIDGIRENKIQKWLKYLPNSSSLYSSRSFNDVLEIEEEIDGEIDNNNKEEEEEESIGEDIWNEIVQYLPISYLNDSLLGRSRRVRFIKDSSTNSIGLPIHFDEIEDIYPLNKFTNIEITNQLTILIYLNNGFIGGQTRFYFSSNNEEDYLEIIPSPGRIVIFDRTIRHSAKPIHSSSIVDKALIKLCALYGRQKESLPSELSLSSNSASTFQTEIINLLKQFEASKNQLLKVFFSFLSLFAFLRSFKLFFLTILERNCSEYL